MISFSTSAGKLHGPGSPLLWQFSSLLSLPLPLLEERREEERTKEQMRRPRRRRRWGSWNRLKGWKWRRRAEGERDAGGRGRARERRGVSTGRCNRHQALKPLAAMPPPPTPPPLMWTKMECSLLLARCFTRDKVHTLNLQKS